MVRRRFKCPKYVRRQALAFRVFGEIRPLLNQFVLPVWLYEDGPPAEIVCVSRAVAQGQMERMKLGDMEQYEASVRPAEPKRYP